MVRLQSSPLKDAIRRRKYGTALTAVEPGCLLLTTTEIEQARAAQLGQSLDLLLRPSQAQPVYVPAEHLPPLL